MSEEDKVAKKKIEPEKPQPVTVEEFQAALNGVILRFYKENQVPALIITEQAGIVPLTVDAANAIILARRKARELEAKMGA